MTHFHQCRHASIHSVPSGGGVGSGRSRIGIRCRDRPRVQSATLVIGEIGTGHVTSTPSTSVWDGTARCSSSMV
jgi:hypothetical protein